MATKEESENPLSLSARIEGLLFVASGGVTPAQLAATLGVSAREVDAGLEELDEFYAPRALRLQKFRGQYKITTAPEIAPLIETFLNLESAFRMTRAALETLAIIAYQQPVTKPNIDAIRGVNSDSVLRNLLSKGLVEEAGRAEGPGRPIYYITSEEFLQHFGLNKLEDLPALTLEDEPGPPADSSENGHNGQPPESDGEAPPSLNLGESIAPSPEENSN
ncbi:MAG: SMC-Scp complex subunit ScpB [Anaerolineales bacterium]|nr:SMC-Scp complex subunit ScpB [Anaerolineales bacterium]